MKRLLLLACGLLGAACSKSSDAPANPVDDSIKGTLEAEIRLTVDVTITKAGDVTLVLGEGDFGVLDANTRLSAKGAIEALPEADVTMYTAVFSAPKRSKGPCGEQPMTLALSLLRRGGNARVGGGLTAYCGASATGVPARLLRLSGDLPIPSAALMR